MSTVEEELARAEALTRPSFDDGRSHDWGNDRATFVPPAPAPPAPMPRPEVTPAPAAAPQAGDLQTRVRSVRTLRWSAILGVTGVVLGGAAAAAFARQMGYDWPLVTQIGVLVGVASGAALAALPPAVRALGWAAIAGGFAALGAGALWLLTRIAPAFVERITTGL